MARVYEYFSLLENDILIPGRWPIGKYWPTQWGKRRIIAHRKVDVTPDADVA